MFIMERKLSYVVFQEDGAFVARCLDVEVASDGTSEQEAVDNLREALELYFEDNGESVGSPGTACNQAASRGFPTALDREDCPKDANARPSPGVFHQAVLQGS
jgi:predicted RNase H-like HicB family nuclease